MRMSQLIGRTVREAPRDSELPSHKYLVRGGYIKQFSSGIWGYLPLAWRSLKKIEQICREEMDSIGGQEIRMPTLATRELWEETGRYQSVGKEMFRLKDRHEKDLVLCMTHEEPVVHIIRSEINSYKQLPTTLYQFQTKFRDEPRPRGGLVRTREFIMKDAYSFHSSEDDLLAYYERAHGAYERFYKRLGFRNFASVRSDNGIFGGKFSHEFMALAPTGEDTLITCPKCTYKANVEVAQTTYAPQTTQLADLAQVETPNCRTIAELVAFLQKNGHASLTPAQTCKAVLFQDPNKKLVVLFLRGDLEAVEQKAVTTLGCELSPPEATALEAAGAVPGSTGPIGLRLDHCRVVIDPSVAGEACLVVGANRADNHNIGFNFERDFFSSLDANVQRNVKISDIAQVVAGDPCPDCQSPLQESRGIEIGNIFHLGTKYSGAMDAQFLDEQGKRHPFIMGCYGIGISRCLAALIEEHHDEYGMILPIPVAPYEVQLNALNLKDQNVQAVSEEIYTSLANAGVEVLFDDRDEKPGSQFADADLIGLPIRLIVAPRSLKSGVVEIKFRDKSRTTFEVPVKDAVQKVKELIAEEYKTYAPG